MRVAAGVVCGVLLASGVAAGKTAQVQTKSGYGAAGCGLGAVLIGDEPGIIQVLALTINGISSNQAFGITSGTLNCPEGVLKTAQLETFVSTNRSLIARDAAAGSGDYLAAVSTLLGCEVAVLPEFFAVVNANVASVFPPDAEPDLVVANLRALVSSDGTLGAHCAL